MFSTKLYVSDRRKAAEMPVVSSFQLCVTSSKFVSPRHPAEDGRPIDHISLEWLHQPFPFLV